MQITNNYAPVNKVNFEGSIANSAQRAINSAMRKDMRRFAYGLSISRGEYTVEDLINRKSQWQSVYGKLKSKVEVMHKDVELASPEGYRLEFRIKDLPFSTESASLKTSVPYDLLGNCSCLQDFSKFFNKIKIEDVQKNLAEYSLKNFHDSLVYGSVPLRDSFGDIISPKALNKYLNRIFAFRRDLNMQDLPEMQRTYAKSVDNYVEREESRLQRLNGSEYIENLINDFHLE